MTDTATNDKVLRGQRLRKIRNMIGLTIIEFANLVKIGESTIRQWEQGKASGLSSKGAYKIWAALLNQEIDFTADWLMTGQGATPQFQQAAASDSVEPCFSTTVIIQETKLIRVEIDRFLKSSYRSIVVTIQDNAMEPLYTIGDTVGGNCLENKHFNMMAGHCVIVKTEQHDILVRKITKSEEAGCYNLYSINSSTTVVPPILSNQKVALVAPITRLWRILPN